jgi:prevent-host-death family protein
MGHHPHMAHIKRVPDEVTMMELRAQPGEVLRAVEVDGRTIRITKNGHVAAKLAPASDTCIAHSDGTFEGELPVTFRRDLGGHY